MHGHAAMRNTSCGSWYIEAVTRTFLQDSHQKSVTDMLTKVRVNQIFFSVEIILTLKLGEQHCEAPRREWCTRISCLPLQGKCRKYKHEISQI